MLLLILGLKVARIITFFAALIQRWQILGLGSRLSIAILLMGGLKGAPGLLGGKSTHQKLGYDEMGGGGGTKIWIKHKGGGKNCPRYVMPFCSIYTNSC